MMHALNDKVAVVTGGGGVLCAEIAEGLAKEGVKTVLLDLDRGKAERVLERVKAAGGTGLAVEADVLVRRDLERAAEKLLSSFNRVDILINGAGGNLPDATTTPNRPFFELPEKAVRFVFDLNFMGTFLASQVFGKVMAKQGEGTILNIASMNAMRPLSRIPAYSAAKAAVANFTQWLAVYMSQEVSRKIRVNAIAPGFFLTEQNRYLLKDKDGRLTERGEQILSHTPMARFGEPSDLLGTVLWLLSSRSSFVHGIVVPIDGGFSAYSGV
jgi:NAD(P)-dependent dehydrogenase (short-subunit alcohol dehydrogenase family)